MNFSTNLLGVELRTNSGADLFSGTIADNNLDMKMKKRAVVGERVCTAKLSEHSVRTMRLQYASGVTTSQLGKRFGVHTRTAWAVVRRKSWVHIA